MCSGFGGKQGAAGGVFSGGLSGVAFRDGVALISRVTQGAQPVAAEREGNIHAHDGITEDEFVQMREARDATLDMPRLILPAVQVNMRAGHMPPADDNGVIYLKIPVNAV